MVGHTPVAHTPKRARALPATQARTQQLRCSGQDKALPAQIKLPRPIGKTAAPLSTPTLLTKRA